MMGKTYKGKEKHKFLKLFKKRDEKRASKKVFYFEAKRVDFDK